MISTLHSPIFELGALVAWTEFFGQVGAARVLLDFGLIGFFGGMFIVPLYAMIQARTAPERRARMIAVNNVINAIFMVAGAGLSIVALGMLGMTIPELLVMTDCCQCGCLDLYLSASA